MADLRCFLPASIVVAIQLFQIATCYAPAKESLLEMVTAIESGEFANNFFDGDLLNGEPDTDVEAAGACLLDKVSAIVVENGAEQLPNKLKVDMAACCTKDREKCIEDVDQAYAALVKLLDPEEEPEPLIVKAASILINAARQRVKEGKVQKSHKHYLRKCMEGQQCSMDILKSKKRQEL
mmetsp:Transcript_132131/g.257452  ORF Transcript_132131/g.257452 Transcript_132131/m.257452 type:complete len:180 (+) Transcript_132131:70-609(+)